MRSQSFENYANDQISVYREMLAFIPKMKEVARTFDGKIVNARFTKALESASPVTHIGAPRYIEKDIPMFRCDFETTYSGARLDIRLVYMGNIYIDKEISNRYYFLEPDGSIYGERLDAELFCKNCDKNAEKIEEEIAELEEILATYSADFGRLAEIYEELKGMHRRIYRAASHTKEYELGRVVDLARFPAY